MSNPSADYAPRTTSGSPGRPYAVAGFICAVVAVFFLPIVLGPVAIALGIVAHLKGDPLGRWAIAAGAAGLVLGFALGALVLHKAKQQSGALALMHLGALYR